jgi:hypothetical protein
MPYDLVFMDYRMPVRLQELSAMVRCWLPAE